MNEDFKKTEGIKCKSCEKINSINNNICIFCGATLDPSNIVYFEQNILPQVVEQVTPVEETNQEVDTPQEDNKPVENNNIPEQITTNNVVPSNSVYCPNCGTEVSKAFRFCTNCGTQLPITENSQNTNFVQQPVQKDSNPLLPLWIILGVFSPGLMAIYPPYTIYLVEILALVSLFFKKFRAFGIASFIVQIIAIVSYAVLLLLLLGMCFGIIGGF